MEFAWVPLLLLSFTFYVFPSGASERCYDVQKVLDGGCVAAIKITKEDEGWFGEGCSPPFHLYRLHGGEASVAATTQDKIVDIITDSNGTPYFLTHRTIDESMEGKAYTLKDGTIFPLVEDNKIFYIEIDKKDSVFISSPLGLYRYKKGTTEKIKNTPIESLLFFSATEGRNYFLSNYGIFWELKPDGTVQEIFLKDSIHKFIKHPNAPGYLAGAQRGLYHVKEDNTVTALYSGHLVFDVESTKDGLVYFTTRQSAFVNNSGEISTVDLPHLKNHSDISIYKDGNDNIYFLTEHAYVLRRNERVPQLVTGLPSDHSIKDVTIDSHNNVIFSADYKNSTNVYFLAENSLKAHLVDEIEEPRTSIDYYGDTTYIGTGKALYSLKSKDICKT